MSRPQDIDYAAAAVKKAILEKFSDVDLESLQVMAITTKSSTSV